MSACSRCGIEFLCGMADSEAVEPCWCTALAALPASALMQSEDNCGAVSCLCPLCLKSKIDSLRCKSD